MRLALAQLNPIVGDIAGNVRLVLDAVDRARARGADAVVCPELVLVGYPPRDLLWREGVVRACEEAVRAIAAAAGGITVIVGHPRHGGDGVRGLRNSVSVCRGGEIVATHDKRLLPGYDVFDEDRYFDPGDGPCIIDLDPGAAGSRFGLVACEDLWQAGDVIADPRYAVDPVADLVREGCDGILAVNASPFIVGKFARHLKLARAAARRHHLSIVAVNQVGANDEIIFDGRSFAIGPGGAVRTVLPAWTPGLETIDLAGGDALEPPAPEAAEELFGALVLGVADYGRKTQHPRVLVGLSGGVDSALTATIAAAAVGPERVRGIIMPSRYSSPGSGADARALAAGLGLAEPEEIPIEEAHRALERALGHAGGAGGVADENVQARLRGLILMARANAGGGLVLATGNKSELAVGYATLYGDMAGAVAVLGDLTKTRVYELARWINAHPAAGGFAAPPIPAGSLSKPPSAELRPNQTDQDTLPPYDVLDAIIERVVEREQSADRIIAETGFDPALVVDTLRMIDRNQFKREQAALILKVTHRAFGRGRPMPLVMRPTAGPSAPPVVPAPEPRRRRAEKRPP